MKNSKKYGSLNRYIYDLKGIFLWIVAAPDVKEILLVKIKMRNMLNY